MAPTSPSHKKKKEKKTELHYKVTPASSAKTEIGTKVALLNTLKKKKLMDESLDREKALLLISPGAPEQGAQHRER